MQDRVSKRHEGAETEGQFWEYLEGRSAQASWLHTHSGRYKRMLIWIDRLSEQAVALFFINQYGSSSGIVHRDISLLFFVIVFIVKDSEWFIPHPKPSYQTI